MSAIHIHRSARTPSIQRVKDFLRYAQRYADRTQQTYKGILWRFYRYMPQYIENLTLEHIEQYLQSVKGINATKNKHLIAIRSFCHYLADFYELPNPVSKIKDLPEEPPRQRVITAEEYNKVLAICNQEEKDIIQWLANTGVRASEFRSITMQSISYDRQYLTLVGKGRKQRIVPLNDICRQIITRQTNSHIYLFESYHKRDALYQLCKKLSRKAGIPVSGPHGCRHFFATRLMQKGVPLAKISKMLGHSSIRTTEQIYIHWLPQDLLGLTDCLDK